MIYKNITELIYIYSSTPNIPKGTTLSKTYLTDNYMYTHQPLQVMH